MKSLKLLFLGLFCLSLGQVAFSQNKSTKTTFTISGYIKDAASSETLIGATVYEQEGNRGTVTNAYGFYSLTLPEGVYQLNYSYVGFQTSAKEIDLKNDLQLDLQLSVTNVYNRKNIFYINRLTGEAVYQLPILPSLGVAFKF